MQILKTIFSIISSFISKLFWLFEFFLFLRLFLQFMGANAQTPVVRFIYKYSGLPVSPFRYIFNNIYWQGHLIELSVVSAMIGYAIAVIIVYYLIKVFSRN